MSRKAKYNEIKDKLIEKLDGLFSVYLTGGVIDTIIGGTEVVGFLDFDTQSKRIDLSLPNDSITIIPDGEATYPTTRANKAYERVYLLVMTKFNASQFAEAVAVILDGCGITSYSINTNITAISQAGLIDLNKVPKFSGSGYSVALISANLYYNVLDKFNIECMDGCCLDTINLGCVEKCEVVELTGLAASTNYKIYVKMPHSPTSGQPVVIMSDSFGVVQLPINPSFTGEYTVRAHENSAIAFTCYKFTVMP